MLDLKPNEHATRQEVYEVKTPEATKTYEPVDYGKFIDLLEAVVTAAGWTIVNEVYGLASSKRYSELIDGKGGEAGAQLFGVWSLVKEGEDGIDRKMALGFRSSHDRSVANGVVGGAHITVCSNLMFSGDAIALIRKHTKNVWKDIEEGFVLGLAKAISVYEGTGEDIEVWKQIDCGRERGFEIMGRALAHGYIKPQQVTLAMAAWDSNLNNFGRSYWGLYNAFTEGTKRGSTVTVIDRHVKIDDWMRMETALWRVVNRDSGLAKVHGEADLNAEGYLH